MDEKYSHYVKQKLTPEILEKIITEITTYYRNNDYLIPVYEISESAFNEGILLINIIPKSIEEVTVIGDAEDNQLIREYCKKIILQNPAKTSQVQRYLALMNDLPGVEAHYRLNKKGDKIELVIVTKEKKWSIYAGVDSYSSNNLGHFATSILAQANAPFNKNETFIIQGSTTNHPDRYNDVGLSYAMPINTEGTKIHLAAFHSADNPNKKGTVEAKTNQGNSLRMSFTHHLLIRANLDLEAEAGVVYKNISNKQVVNNQSVPSQKSKYLMADLGLKYLIKDRVEAKNLFSVSYLQSLGGTFSNYINNESVDKKFSIGRFNYFREQPLPNNFELFTQIGLTYSESSVPDAEKATLGGREFGRGYGNAILDGTRLSAIANELRYNKDFSENHYINRIQPYIFHDIGNLGTQGNSTDVSKLESAGLGVRFKLKHEINLGLEAAIPFTKNYIIDGASYKANTNYSFFINKIVEF